MVWTSNILLAVIAGLFSGSLIYLYSYKREKARLVIEYAKRTADRAQLIKEETKRCSEGKTTEDLKRLIDNIAHRQFAGDIVDRSPESVELQKTIAGCNLTVSKIQGIYEKHEANSNSSSIVFQQNLMHKYYELNNAWLDAINAIADYDIKEDKEIIRWHKNAKRCVYIFLLAFLIVFLVELKFCIG